MEFGTQIMTSSKKPELKYLRYAILFLILCNVSSALLFFAKNGALASIVSYLSYLLMIVYFIHSEKTGPNYWMILIGLLYYLIGLVQFNGNLNVVFLPDFFKYFVVVICGNEIVKKTSLKEFTIILILGASTVLLDATILKGDTANYGRPGGFYINPNGASFICGIAYALTFGMKQNKLRLFIQFFVTLMGFMTLSRTFVATWTLINLLSLLIDLKNIKVFFFGIVVVFSVLEISNALNVNNARIRQLNSLVNNEKIEINDVSKDSRSDTWALFYDDIFESPFFGSGYKTFQGELGVRVGTHNTFLMIMGETGILPTLLFIIFYLSILIASVKLFFDSPHLLMALIVLIIFLMVSHIYFTHHFILFISLWLQNNIYKSRTK